MATGTETTPATTEMLSLQSRIEQCEAAIKSAHTTLNGMELTTAEDKAAPHAEGAMAAIDRCNSEMHELNVKLTALAERVGRL